MPLTAYELINAKNSDAEALGCGETHLKYEWIRFETFVGGRYRNMS